MKQFMFASALALSLGVMAQGANYYVDGTAAKGGDGSATAPYPTIQQAADVAQAGDTVFIKPGTYTETVKPKNSGKEGSPITFRNCPGEEKPTICAGDRVTGPWKDEGGGIYSAACPWNVGSARNHEPAALTNGLAYAGNVVVVDGDLMIEAREPNISGKEQLATACRLGRQFPGEFRKDGDVVVRGVPGWDAGFWKGGTVWFVGGWNATSACITNSQVAGADCQLSLGAKKVAFGWPKEGGGWAFLTGAKGALNHEKEFFLDEAAGRLYLMAPGGVDPSGMAVYAKRRFTVIDLTGLNYVVFDRVNTMMGGITLATATHCSLLNSRHLYSSHFYFFTGAGHPLGGDMSRTYREAAAMYISGEENRIEGCEIAYAATGVMLDGRNHVIRNCSITDIYGGDYFSSIYIAPFFPVDGIGPNHDAANVSCGGHLIERNTLARASRGFINIAEKTGGKGTTYQKIRILYNDMSDYMLNTEDGGSVYQWCVNGSGTEVAYNWIHGDHGNYAFNPALYADNDCLNFRYHHNVIWDVKLGIGWNQTSGYLEAYNNTVWARDLGAKNEAIKVTVAVPGCKIFNNLANQTIGGAGPASSQTNNLVVGGGFAGNPNHPASGLDFILASNSPAINAGMVITGVTDRAVGAPDVGAYEFGGPEWTAGAGTEPVAPTAPIEFGATAIGAQGIRLGWTDVAFNEKAYVLERSTDGKSWATVANLPANAFTYLDAGFHLKAGTGYQYRLAATNDYGSSAWVSIKTATPTAAKVPAITSALTAKGVQGVTFTYTILAANDPAEVTAEGLPKGLAFNPATGVIAGYAETAGEAKVNLTATNAKGTDTKTLTLTIAKSELVAIKGGTVSEYADLPAPPGVGGQAGAAGVRWTVLIFTNNGSFAVSGGPAEYLIVAGGGGGGARGGGGAGGVLTGSVNSISGEHKVTVGGGGGFGTNGEPSSISGPVICWTAAGGGYGGTWNQNGGDGGSGGGGGSGGPIPLKTGGTSVYPLMFAGQEAYAVKQGNRGGNGLGDNYRGAGGGGAGGVGGDDDRSSSQCAGGPGISSTLGDGKTVVRYAAGGGGGGNGPKGLGGSGIGGDAAEAKIAATDGKPNTGSGGGAGGGKGGSGIVIVRFVRTGM